MIGWRQSLGSKKAIPVCLFVGVVGWYPLLYWFSHITNTKETFGIWPWIFLQRGNLIFLSNIYILIICRFYNFWKFDFVLSIQVCLNWLNIEFTKNYLLADFCCFFFNFVGALKLSNSCETHSVRYGLPPKPWVVIKHEVNRPFSLNLYGVDTHYNGLM